MNSQPLLIDLGPSATFLLIVVGISSLILGWWWIKNRHKSKNQIQASLAMLTLVLTFDLVLFGAFTRLTDSGLGCPDWPGCYGMASPIGAATQINQARDLLPTGPVTPAKAWIEMIHRYLAAAVGLQIAVLAGLAWANSRSIGTNGRQATDLRWISSASLVWVCVVGAFGALTVTMKLQPAIVTTHLLGALALLSLLAVQVVKLRYQLTPSTESHLSALRREWRALLATLAVWLQIALGGWVSTNYAVLACNTFPTCNGSWWPDMDIAQGFTVWRQLGQNGAGRVLDISALVGIHYVHRLAAYLVIGLIVWLGLHIWRNGNRRIATILIALATLQVMTGVANVVLNWPLAAALMHTGGAAALSLTLTWLLTVRLAGAGQKLPLVSPVTHP